MSDAQDDEQVTLDAAGNGQMTFNSGSTRVKKVISRLVLNCRAGTTSGIINLYKNSSFLESGPLGASVTVYGEGEEILPGQLFRIDILQGPANTVVTATLYHRRESL